MILAEELAKQVQALQRRMESLEALEGCEGATTTNALTLADETSGNISPDAGTVFGIFVVICASVAVCLAGYDNSTGFYILSDPRDRYRTTDTDGYHCFLMSGADATIKNRRGVSCDYRIHILGL